MIRFIVLICLVLQFTYCNTKGPATPDYKTIKGVVLQREVCHLDPQKDDWLLDLGLMTDPPFGDTLTLDGR